MILRIDGIKSIVLSDGTKDEVCFVFDKTKLKCEYY